MCTHAHQPRTNFCIRVERLSNKGVRFHWKNRSVIPTRFFGLIITQTFLRTLVLLLSKLQEAHRTQNYMTPAWPSMALGYFRILPYCVSWSQLRLNHSIPSFTLANWGDLYQYGLSHDISQPEGHPFPTYRQRHFEIAVPFQFIESTLKQRCDFSL